MILINHLTICVILLAVLDDDNLAVLNELTI